MQQNGKEHVHCNVLVVISIVTIVVVVAMQQYKDKGACNYLICVWGGISVFFFRFGGHLSIYPMFYLLIYLFSQITPFPFFFKKKG